MDTDLNVGTGVITGESSVVGWIKPEEVCNIWLQLECKQKLSLFDKNK